MPPSGLGVDKRALAKVVAPLAWLGQHQAVLNITVEVAETNDVVKRGIRETKAENETCRYGFPGVSTALFGNVNQ